MLVCDVINDPFHLRGFDGKGAVALLPVEIFVGLPFAFDPFGGVGFYLLDQLHESDFWGEHAENVDMVDIAADLNHGALEFVANAAEVGVEFRLHRCFDPWPTAFGAEDDVNVIFYERLSHGQVCFDGTRLRY